MYFASDNWAGAHRSIAERLLRESDGFAAAYGASDLDRRVERRFAEVFEREVAVLFVGTGTAANSLSLASVQRPGGITFCHSEAHVIADECGAPDFFSGARLLGVPGAEGKIDPARLSAKIAAFPQTAVQHGRATAVTITQATEAGTVYSLKEIDEIAAIARKDKLPLHMDGARFANALVSLGVSPAEMTWKRGIDMLSFGGTKNGCWCAEAIVFFNPERAKEMPFIRKRAAQLFSKSRFIAAQFDAYFETISGSISPAMRTVCPIVCARASPRATRPGWRGRPRPTKSSPSFRKARRKRHKKRARSSMNGRCHRPHPSLSAGMRR